MKIQKTYQFQNNTENVLKNVYYAPQIKFQPLQF